MRITAGGCGSGRFVADVGERASGLRRQHLQRIELIKMFFSHRDRKQSIAERRLDYFVRHLLRQWSFVRQL